MGLFGNGQVLNQIEIDFLLVHLRRELDQVNRALAALERMARTRRRSVPKRPIARERAAAGATAKGWTRHRRRTG
jgi:hypothetical protein